MANWAYLTVTDEPRIYPGFQNPLFDDAKSWILASAGCVPLLWLALFAESDLVQHEFSDRRGAILAFAPVAPRLMAVARLRVRAGFLNALFAANGGVAHHLDLFSDYVAKQDGRYITIQVDEIECLYEAGVFNQLLRAALRGLDASDPGAGNTLVQLSTIILERRFVTLAEANAGAYDPQDMSNYFRITGEGYVQTPPWE
jgi:hypothetical protein